MVYGAGIKEDRAQEIEIFLNYIGRVELPAQELSEEEMAVEEKKRKRRAYSRAYLKEYRKKHRSEIDICREKAVRPAGRKDSYTEYVL